MVNNDLAKMASTQDATQRNSYTAQIDMQVMKDAAILPEVYAKSLLYRSPNITNVYVQPYYGMYNYAVLGREVDQEKVRMLVPGQALLTGRARPGTSAAP